MIKADNRARLRQLMTRAGMTREQAAEAITRGSGTRVSLRALDSWLADPALPSARACPGWAVTILEGMVRKKGRER